MTENDERQLEMFSAAPPPKPRRVPEREELVQLADVFARRLSVQLARPVKLQVTDNRTAMLTVKRGKTPVVRLHHMFLFAPVPVVNAVAAYVDKGSTGAGRVIDQYVFENDQRIRVSKPTSPEAGQGKTHHLAEMFESLNHEYFDGKVDATIAWASVPRRRARRSIRFGSYGHRERHIRIHPRLDHPLVPRYFVEFIIFHEMLHQVFPTVRKKGRAIHHSAEFNAAEQRFKKHDEAMRWEKQNLKWLLGR